MEIKNVMCRHRERHLSYMAVTKSKRKIFFMQDLSIDLCQTCHFCITPIFFYNNLAKLT